MDNATGLIAPDQLRVLVEEGSIDTVDVAFTDHYGRLMGKRYDAGFFLKEACSGGAHACDYLLTVDMEMEPVPGFRLANWERGYGDLHLMPDLSTLRILSWREKTALVLCDVHDPVSHGRLDEAPRSILRRQLERAESLGFSAAAASELEFYIFENGYRAAAEQERQRGFRAAPSSSSPESTSPEAL